MAPSEGRIWDGSKWAIERHDCGIALIPILSLATLVPNFLTPLKYLRVLGFIYKMSQECCCWVLCFGKS